MVVYKAGSQDVRMASAYLPLDDQGAQRGVWWEASTKLSLTLARFK